MATSITQAWMRHLHSGSSHRSDQLFLRGNDPRCTHLRPCFDGWRTSGGDECTTPQRDGSVAITVNAVNDAPVANAGGPYNISEGDGITLDASASSDLDLDTLTYSWDINNDTVFDDVTGVSPTLTWAQLQSFGINDDGVYTITVKADDGTVSNSASTTITVDNVAPTLIATGTGSALEGAAYTLNLSAIDPGDDTIASWTINWGDGDIETIAGNPASVTHVYDEPGFTYSVTVSAQDEDGVFFDSALLVASAATGTDGFVIRYGYDPLTGAADLANIQIINTTTPSDLDWAGDVIVGPDGFIYVTGYQSNNVVRFNAGTGLQDAGFEISTSQPVAISFGPDGNLYVVSDTKIIKSYDVSNPATAINSWTISYTPEEMTFGPDGKLYIGDYVSPGRIYQHDITDMVWTDDAVFTTGMPAASTRTEQFAFGPDGNLYVSRLSGEILRFNGTTGAYIDIFATPGTQGAGWPNGPTGVAFGPDGNLYVTRVDSVIRYDGTTGAYIDDFVPAGNGVVNPWFTTFTPNHQVYVQNSAPTLANGTLAGTFEDDTNPAGQTIASIFTGKFTDLNGTFNGIAVVGNPELAAEGLWQYSTDSGTTWYDISAVADDATALVLETSSLIRFLPATDFNGNPGTLEVRALDNMYFGDYTDGATRNNIDASSNGNGTPLAVTTTTIATIINAVNDAPVLDTIGTPTLTQIDEGDTNNSGDSVASIIASASGDPITDVDASAVEGIAITWADNSNGAWEYSTDGGSNWFAIGTVSDSSALLLTDDANNRIRFVPATNYNGAAQFSYRAWDQTDSNANATADVDVSTNGTTMAYSTATETADIIIQPVQVILYMSTSGDVSVSDSPGLDSWAAGEVLALGDPNASFEPGTTDGTFYSFLDLRNFNTGTIDPAIDGIHQVSKNTTIGGNGGPSMDLFVGDILFAINSNSVQLTGSDLVEITTNKKDLLMFRADTPGDYSTGTFSVVLDNFSTNEVEGITLVEVDTMVGDTLLQAGTFLYNPGNSRDIFHYTADGVGAGTTTGVTTTLIAGNDINMTSASAKVSGIDLIEADVTLGDTSLTAGNILVTLDGNDAGVGNNNLSVTSNDVFYLDVTTTTMGVTSTTTANAYLLIEGADLNLDTASEEITAISLDIKFGSGNEDPDISFPGSSINYTENDPAVIIDAGATVVDPDSFDFGTGILRADFSSGGMADDRLAINNEGTGAGQVGVTGNVVTYSNVTIGTFTGGTGSNPLVIKFNSSSSPAVVQAVMRNITYENVGDNLTTTPRTIRFIVTDGDGGTSNIENKTINTFVVNDSPTIATNIGMTVAEGSTGTVITTAMLNEGDPDDSGSGVTYTVTTIPANGSMYLSGVALNNNDTFTQADIDAGLITYDHDGSQNLSDSFTFSIADGGEDGATALSGQVFSVTVTNVNDAPTGTVSIAGVATEDQILTASNTLADADGLGAVSYQWQRGGSDIAGATNTTYTLTDADVGATITVVASYTDGEGTAESVSSAGVGPIANINDAPTGAVSIAGVATEDQILTASNTLSDADGMGTVSYQWQRGGSNIAGATNTTYTLTDADVGTTITVVASYTDGNSTNESVSSAGVGPIANVNDAPTGTVSIAGVATEDQILTASNTLADADGMGTVSYQWQRGGSDIAGATAGTYTLTDADVGTTITVVASYTDGNSTIESVSSAGVGPIANINDVPTGAVNIAGVATENQILTASNTLADADGLGAITYQWQRGGSNIAGATASTYTLTDADVGATITVVASYTDGNSTNESVSSAGVGPIANINDAPTGTVNIAGVASEDQILTASNTLADADGLGVITYQWQRGGSDIAGATAGTYTLTDADVGATITVVASYTDGNSTLESESSAGVGPIANVNDAPTGTVSIAGIPTEDQILTASNTLADDDGLGTITYQWQRGGSNISGATNTTYTLTDADVGTTITVVASYTDGNSTNESASSAGVGPIANVNDVPTGTVSIAGIATEDQILTASNTLADDDGLGTITYQWQRGGSNIAGATASTYTLTDADVGATITVVASYTDGNSTNESVSSAGVGPIANVNDLPTGTVSIAGTPTEDQILTASNTLADTDGMGTVSYQWQRGGSDIAGATNTTYTLTDADVGATITVVASYTDGNSTLESVSSAGVGPIANINDAPTGTVSIAGTPTEDQILTASNALADDDGLGAITYQWQRGGSDIAGETNTTYTLTDADVDATITVVASYTDGNSANESVSSAGVGPIANINDAPTGTVNIAGTPTEDQILTASNTLADADGLGTITYQWQRGGSDIAGATAGTYTLTDADVGTTITVVASYTDGNSTLESVSSTSVGPIANVNDVPTGTVSIAGVATEDQILTASNTLSDDDGMGTVSYQWQSGGSDIAGATAGTYTLTDADVGATITVVASYTDGNSTNESVSSAGVGPIANINDAPTGAVSIAGVATEDQILTASNTLADADGLGTITYQWQRGGSDIAGATNTTYTLTDADVGATITVVASYTDGNSANESVNSAGVGPIANINDVPTGAVNIAGVATEDQILTASNTLADADGMGTVSYQWQRGGSDIAGATASTYTLSDADVGATITVVASYTDGNSTAESMSSAGVGPVANINDAPTGTVSIAGTPTEDQVLTASNTLADADGLGAITYQWQRGGSDIAGATAGTYTLTDADVGATITVVASYTDGNSTNESVNSAGVGPIANINDAPTGAVNIAGVATEDQILTASNTLADADGMGTVSYQWQRGGSDIAGATAGTYTLADADVGTTITVVASYTDGNSTLESESSAGVGPIANINDTPTGTVSIAGTPTEDQILTASNTLADADGLGTITYQWQRGGSDIAGATNTTYTLTDADVGATITVVASYTDGNSANESVNSAGVGPIANINDVPTGTVSIAGVATEDQILTVSNTLADADGLGTITYQWQRGGSDIAGSTNTTYTLTDADVGATITVVASYTDGSSTNESVSSAGVGPIANINDIPSGSVLIDNTTPAEGDTLTASNSLADADGLSGAITYQWQRDGIDIVGETGNTYTTAPADVGAVISVIASYTDDQSTAENVSSAATAAVTNVNNTPTGVVSIAGTPTEDQILTASNTLADVDGMGAVSYQWQRGGSDIVGATASTYTLTDADVGATITVVASYTDGNSTNESVSSAGVGPIANINDAPTGTVSIAGTPTEDQILTASNTLADADGLGAITYQWQRGGSDITGATASTYTLTDADVGATITVVASYTDGNSTNESVSSAGVGPIANINDAPTGAVSIAGVATEDQILTVSNTLADADGLGAITYQWQRGGSNIAGATASTYTLTDADVGATITVVASYTDGNSTNESVSSAGVGPIANINDAPTGAVSIAGVATEDQILTASNTLADADGLGVITYQWQRGGSNIAGATNTTYTLNDADVGATITVVASYTDGNSTNESVSSAGVGPIANINDVPTGSVSIAGVATEDQILTASNTLADADGLGAITYQWQRGGSNIAGATNTTYTLTDADVGTTITVVASYTDGNSTNESVSSAGVGPIANINDAPTGTVSIAGTPTEDQILTASNTLADADGLGTITYQWQRGGSDIAGATNTTYTLTDADVGATITVVASYTDGNSANESVNSAGVGPIANINDAPTGTVNIAGTPTEDQILTASNTLADADGLGAITYQWQRGGSDISGATTSTYTLTDADVGTTITVVASYTDGNSTNESVSSAGVGPIANVNDAPTGTVSIAGTPTEDQILTASNTLADADGLGAITYQWQRGGSDIAGATAGTYTLTDADVGTTITVVASYTDGNSTLESVSSTGVGPIANVNDVPTGTVSIAGVATEDQILTASNTLSDDDGMGTVSYQWQRGGSNIAGATNTTYTLTDADVGTTITVVASYTDGNSTNESVSSAGVGPIANINDVPTGTVSIAGTPTEDQILTASNTLADADGMGTVSYQWQRGGSDIAGATAGTYTLTDADVGTTITVVASYTDGNSTNESVSSAGVGPIANINDVPTGTVSIAGTPTEDQILTASNTLADADGMGTVSYQWQRGGSDIAGATASTYTLTDADVGATITVVASYTDGNSTNESVSSAGVGPIANINDTPTGTVSIAGTPTEDQVLTASNTLADADGLGTITYQWQRGGSDIAGATAGTYTLTDADVGTTITVVASYTDGNSTVESVSSAGVGPIANVNDAPTGTVSIAGTPTEDQILTASNTLADADGLGAITYQWQRGGSDIAGATNTTYALTDADVGTTITVVASYTDGNSTNESVSSAGVGPIANINDVPTGAVNIAGVATEDQILTASNTLADADGLGTITYQWQRGGSDIAGATTSTYTLTDADVGATITVVASYTDGNSTLESVSSAGVGPIANVNDPAIISGADTGNVTEDVDPDADNLLETSGVLTITDIDAGEASFTAGTLSGLYGNLTINAAGNWTYAADNTQAVIQSLAASDTLTDTISVTSLDGTTHDVIITIGGVNDAPTALNDTPAAVNEGGTAIFDLAANDFDIDGSLDLNSISIVSAPANGSLIINGDGTVSYTHNGSETLSDSFSYTIADINGAISNTAMVNISINALNDNPVANNDVTSLNEGGVVIIDLAANDTDADNVIDLNSIGITAAPVNGAIVVNADGTVTYTHDGSETLSDSFSYTISDIGGAISNMATVTISVIPTNEAPTTIGIIDVTVNEDAANTTVNLNAVFNDVDNPDSELTYSVVGNTNIGLFTSASINAATGELTLDYAANMNGSTQISIRATDLAGASVDTLFTVTVSPVNDTPALAVNDGALLTDSSEMIINNGQLSTSDVDNTATEVQYIITALPDSGVLMLSGVAMQLNDTFTEDDLASNRISYQMGASTTVNDQFMFTVTDGSSALTNNQFNIVVQLSIPLEPPDEQTDPVDIVTPVVDSTTPGVTTNQVSGVPDEITYTAINSITDNSIPQQPLQLSTVPLPQDIASNESMEDYYVPVENKDYADNNIRTVADIQIKSMRALLTAIDHMKDGMGENMNAVEFTSAAVSSSGMVLTTGVVAWVLRSGAMMASMISTIPLWKGYDPLTLLAYRDDEDENNAEDNKDDELEVLDIKKLKAEIDKYSKLDNLFDRAEVGK